MDLLKLLQACKLEFPTQTFIEHNITLNPDDNILQLNVLTKIGGFDEWTSFILDDDEDTVEQVIQFIHQYVKRSNFVD